MRFTRKPAAHAAVFEPIEVVREAEVDDGRLAVLDALGEGFELLRRIDIGRGLWRPDATDLDGLERRHVVVLAAYSAEDITSYRPLMQQCMTIVLAMGLGPRYGSRALTLGAVGYIDGAMDHGNITGAFSDAFARVGTRRQRELVA